MSMQGPTTQVKHMRWEDGRAEPCDILLGADILYDPGSAFSDEWLMMYAVLESS